MFTKSIIQNFQNINFIINHKSKFIGSNMLCERVKVLSSNYHLILKTLLIYKQIYWSKSEDIGQKNLPITLNFIWKMDPIVYLSPQYILVYGQARFSK